MSDRYQRLVDRQDISITTNMGNSVALGAFPEGPPRHYLNRMTVVAGGSGSGKSMTVAHLINLLREYIGAALVFVPESSKTLYPQQIEKNFIIHKQPGEEDFRSIFTMQQKRAKIFDNAHNIDFMIALARIIKPEFSTAYDVAKQRLRVDGSDPTHGHNIHYFTEVENLNMGFCKNVVLYCINNRDSIDKSQLDEDQRNVVMLGEINPNLLIIIDDYTEKLTEWTKPPPAKNGVTEVRTMEMIATKGRHIYITTMIITHKITALSPTIRNNAQQFIMTSKDAVEQIKRDKNLPQPQTKAVCDVLDVALPNNSNIKPFKVSYCPELTPNFSYLRVIQFRPEMMRDEDGMILDEFVSIIGDSDVLKEYNNAVSNAKAQC